MGGVADVVRDLPAALIKARWRATVLTPSYGLFHTQLGAKQLASISVAFGGANQLVDVFELPVGKSQVRSIAFEHPNFSPLGRGQIYCSADAEGPFATDASKFAFFGATAAAWIKQLADQPDVVHLHDWHAAFYLLLREFAPEYSKLRKLRTVFTIHNLSYQGTRPLRNDRSSLEEWFPGLAYDATVVRDPLEKDCINPMALAVRTSDMISTVSPTYAKEIRRASNPAKGYIGGEGLEAEIDLVAQAGRLVGILNGCEYGDKPQRRPGWQRIVALAGKQVSTWLADDPKNAAHKLALQRLGALPKRRPKNVLVSIGRLVEQKVSLFVDELANGRTALEHIIDNLGRQGVLILLGSGDAQFETRILELASRHERLIFLRGYSESLAEPLYQAGDLFLMPSSFEPCGISQMLAMRAGQPCVVHGVGGLEDTVRNDATGFVFVGDDPAEQATNFVTAVTYALNIKNNERDRWQQLCTGAAAQRFSWSQAASKTVKHLYDHAD